MLSHTLFQSATLFCLLHDPEQHLLKQKCDSPIQCTYTFVEGVLSKWRLYYIFFFKMSHMSSESNVSNLKVLRNCDPGCPSTDGGKSGKRTACRVVGSVSQWWLMLFWIEHWSIKHHQYSYTQKNNVGSSLVLRVRQLRCPIVKRRTKISCLLQVDSRMQRRTTPGRETENQNEGPKLWSSKQFSVRTRFLICHELCFQIYVFSSSILWLCHTDPVLCCPWQVEAPNLNARNLSRMIWLIEVQLHFAGFF